MKNQKYITLDDITEDGWEDSEEQRPIQAEDMTKYLAQEVKRAGLGRKFDVFEDDETVFIRHKATDSTVICYSGARQFEGPINEAKVVDTSEWFDYVHEVTAEPDEVIKLLASLKVRKAGKGAKVTVPNAD